MSGEFDASSSSELGAQQSPLYDIAQSEVFSNVHSYRRDVC